VCLLVLLCFYSKL
jgi:hypothetical protein